MNYLFIGKYVFSDYSDHDGGLLHDAGVLVSDSVIEEVGDAKAMRLKYPDAEVVGGDSCMILPGFINAHSHGNGLSFVQRGIGFDFLENSLYDWSRSIAIPPELNAALSAYRHLRNGCTMMHHNEMGIACDPHTYDKLSASIKTYRSSGLRLALSPGIRDVNFIASDDEAFYETLPQSLKEFANPMIFFDKKKAREMYFEMFDALYHDYHSDMTRIFLGPCWAHGCTDEYLTMIKQAAEDYGHIPIHIHTLQTPIQKAYGMRKFGKSLLERLDQFGLVDDNLTLGHAVYLSERDIELLSEKGASVTHHASCNLAMRNGISPAWYLQKAGVNIALGIDEKGINDDEDPFMELRMIFYLSRVSGYDLINTPALTPYEVLRMGTHHSSRSLGVQKIVGSLKKGMKADILSVELDDMENDPCVVPETRPEFMLIHRGLGRYVKDVFVDGQPVIRNRKCLTIDVDALYGEIRKVVKAGPSDTARAYANKMVELKPYMQRWYAGWENFETKPYYTVNTRV